MLTLKPDAASVKITFNELSGDHKHSYFAIAAVSSLNGDYREEHDI
jgi:hypothetical protein